MEYQVPVVWRCRLDTLIGEFSCAEALLEELEICREFLNRSVDALRGIRRTGNCKRAQAIANSLNSAYFSEKDLILMCEILFEKSQ